MVELVTVTEPAAAESTVPLHARSDMMRGIRLLLELCVDGARADMVWFQPGTPDLSRVVRMNPSVRVPLAEHEQFIALSEHVLTLGLPNIMAPSIRRDVRLKDFPTNHRQLPDAGFFAWAIVVNGERLGVMCMARADSGLLTANEHRHVMRIAELVTICLRAHYDAAYDELTGLMTRRQGHELLLRELRRSARRLQPTCVSMLDLDHFKLLNDSRGHAAGDAALKSVAQLLQKAYQRAGDVVIRWGGEEILILQPGVNALAAEEYAKRVRDDLRALDIPNPAAPLGCVTASIGVATYAPAPGTPMINPDEIAGRLISEADRALYAAKNGGRNQVVATEVSVEIPDQL